MTFWDSLFGKKVTIQIRDANGKSKEVKASEKQFREWEAAGKVSRVETVVAHVLDPKTGYAKQTWRVGPDIESDTVKRLGENGEIFVVVAYEQGEPKTMVCKRAVWLQVKAQHDEIDRAGEESMQRIMDDLNKLR
ncbi:MAG: hypothetical protein O3A59_04480 [Nitrospirae bacterium]|nr:hypothetical protein [Nitrospirota bacterium]